MSLLSVVNRVLPEIKPTLNEHQELIIIAKRVINKLIKGFGDKGVNVEVIVGGSFARRTYLHGSHDIDLFVRFNNEEEMSVFNEVIKELFPKAELLKGSRGYYHFFVNNVEVQVIPTIKLIEPFSASNSMDVSYFHVQYLNSRLNDSLRDEVLLLKQFLKSCGVYGAESHIKGFSGYVTELLIIGFGGFKQLLEYVDSGVKSLFLDLGHYYDSPKKAITALKSNPLVNPVIIVDPVLPTRNAAASVSNYSWNKFVLTARLFLRNPSQSYFKIKEFTINDARDRAVIRGHHLFSKKFVINSKKDVFLAKLVSKLEQLKKVIELNGFNVYDYGYTDDNFVFFELEQASLPITKRVIGPPVTINSEHFNSFIKKEAVYGPYVFNNRVCFDVKREVTKARDLINKLLKDI